MQEDGENNIGNENSRNIETKKKNAIHAPQAEVVALWSKIFGGTFIYLRAGGRGYGVAAIFAVAMATRRWPITRGWRRLGVRSAAEAYEMILKKKFNSCLPIN